MAIIIHQQRIYTDALRAYQGLDLLVTTTGRQLEKPVHVLLAEYPIIQNHIIQTAVIKRSQDQVTNVLNGGSTVSTNRGTINAALKLSIAV